VALISRFHVKLCVPSRGVVMAEVSPASRTVRFGAYELDLRTAQLKKHGLRVKLQRQPAQILVLLVSKPGEVLTREQLRGHLWSDDTFVDFDHGLNNSINRIREVLCDSVTEPRFIETVPKTGYRFIGKVEEVEIPLTLASAAERHELGANDLKGGSRPPHRAIRIAAWGAILVLTLGMGGRTVRMPPPIHSLVVLPFDNLSGDASQDYFADGMTDALITDLAKIRSLRVISRTSSMHYKGSRKSLPEIAKELDVDGVLEGSFVRSGHQLRITAQLIEAPSDQHLWAESYDRDVSSVVQLQDDVARTVAREIALKLTPQEQTRLVQAHPANIEAYEAYLRGRYFWNLRTVDGLKKGKEYFEQAIQKDADYAPAYAGLADSYNLMTYSVVGWMIPDVSGPKAIEAANKALQLDSNLAEAHAALGFTKFRFSGDLEGAEKELQRAIELNPSYATAQLWLGLYFDLVGRGQEACVSFRTAHQLDPLNPNIGQHLSWCLFTEGKYDEAIEEARRDVELDPRHVNTRETLAEMYEQRGRLPEAVTEYEKAVEVSGGEECSRLALAHAQAAFGKRAEAERTLTELKANSKGDPYCLTFAYVGLGRHDDAIRSLEQAFLEHSPGMKLIASEWRFDPLKADPRFQALVRRAGVPQ
jgi:TolB-like protein/DNA-binding winged helix-turn-helix (wHTH) protein/Flp pilus assembly protein TadD